MKNDPHRKAALEKIIDMATHRAEAYAQEARALYDDLVSRASAGALTQADVDRCLIEIDQKKASSRAAHDLAGEARADLARIERAAR